MVVLISRRRVEDLGVSFGAASIHSLLYSLSITSLSSYSLHPSQCQPDCTSIPRLICYNLLTNYYSFNSSYYGKDYRAGAALLRARRPYLFKNAITGLGLCGFTIGVCTLIQVERSCLVGQANAKDRCLYTPRCRTGGFLRCQGP